VDEILNLGLEGNLLDVGLLVRVGRGIASVCVGERHFVWFGMRWECFVLMLMFEDKIRTQAQKLKLPQQIYIPPRKRAICLHIIACKPSWQNRMHFIIDVQLTCKAIAAGCLRSNNNNGDVSAHDGFPHGGMKLLCQASRYSTNQGLHWILVRWLEDWAQRLFPSLSGFGLLPFKASP
jgi:hypothetical protein